VYPAKHRVPILVSGPEAEEALGVLRALGFVPELAGDRVGQASSIKMLRSVMIKGMEALTAECVLAARQLGVEAHVLTSLQASTSRIDWPVRANHNLERMTTHGRRRAAEMREVANMLAEYGFGNGMTASCIEWQDRLGSLGLPADAEGLPDRADRILAALKRRLGGAGAVGGDRLELGAGEAGVDAVSARGRRCRRR
jgi:3-hydroxyisobutyrate dehydrogenase-like beta-hydroxyacid dehydrogenase